MAKVFVDDVRRMCDQTTTRACYRPVGFCTPAQKAYHGWITDLTVDARLLYPLCRLRWQRVLRSKTSKRSFNLDQRRCADNPRIIESPVRSSLVAVVSAQLPRPIAARTLDRDQCLAISVQRLGRVIVQPAAERIALITRGRSRRVDRLLSKIALFASEIVEKNHRKRRTSVAAVSDLIVA